MADNNTQQYKWENDYYKNLYDQGVKNLNKEYLDTALKTVSQQNQAAYALRKQEQQQAEQSFYQQLYNTNQTVMDTLRKNNASAIASGASKGAQAANELAAILQGQQTGVQAATDLANENYNLAAEAQQTNAQNMLTATESAQTAAAQAAIGLADTLQTDQNQWVENQISNYLAELAAGENTTLSQAEWLEHTGWLKAHNVDVDFKNADGYKDTYNKLFAAQGVNSESFTMTTADKYSRDISEVSNNAARLYKFNLDGSDYQIKSATDQSSSKKAADNVALNIIDYKNRNDENTNTIKNALDAAPIGSYMGFTTSTGAQAIVYKSNNQFVLFYQNDGYNTTATNNKGFNTLWNSLAASEKIVTV